MNKQALRPFAIAALLALTATPAVAEARVLLRGSWPDAHKKVSVDVTATPRSQALRKVTEAAGLSLVLPSPTTDPVDAKLDGVPLRAALDALLGDDDYVATREANVITITRASALPAGADQGRDRKVNGHGLTVEQNETVHDVTVRGGSLTVKGTVTGDVEVSGGSVHVQNGARVLGSIKVRGGSLQVDDEAAVEGDVNVSGGSVQRGERSRFGGAIETRGGGISLRVLDDAPSASQGEGNVSAFARKVGDGLTRAALLFVLGTVLLALAPSRMQTLREEIAARPARSFALGLVSLIGLAAILAGLCVTVVGIPVAVIVALAAPLATFTGIAAALSVAGQGALAHRTQSPHVQLGVACAALSLLGMMPFIGNWVWGAAALIGLGAVVATRGAGLFPWAKAPVDLGPYRTPHD